MPSCDELRGNIDDDLHLKWIAVTGRSPDELRRLHEEYNVVYTWKFGPRAFTERMISAARDAKDDGDLTKRVELDVASQARDQETLQLRMLNDSHTQLWKSSSDPRNYIRQVCKRSSSRQDILEGLAALLYQEENDAMESCSAGGSGDSAGNNADDGSGSGNDDQDHEPPTLYMPPQMEILRKFFESDEAEADSPREKLAGGSGPASPNFAHKPRTRSVTTSTISEQDTSWPVIDSTSPSLYSVLDVESTKSESYVSDAADQNNSGGSQTTDCVPETRSNDCHTKSELPSPNSTMSHQHSDGDQGSTLQAQRSDGGEHKHERDYESPQSPYTKGRFDHGISPPDGQRKHPLHEDQDQGGGIGLKRRRIS